MALSYCLEAVKIKEEIASKETLVTSLVNLARIYKQTGNVAEALQTNRTGSEAGA